MGSKQNIQAISKWQAENTDMVRFRTRKADHIPERIQIAVDAGKDKSRQAYIVNAVKQRLDADGIPIIPNDVDASEPK